MAFFFKWIRGTAAFVAGLIGQLVVLVIHVLVTAEIIELGFLMYNVIGSVVVILLVILIQTVIGNKKKSDVIRS